MNFEGKRLAKGVAVAAAAGVTALSGCGSSTSSPKTPEYATYLQEFCAQPDRQPIDIYVWNRANVLSATTYENANDQECKQRGIPVRVVISNRDVSTGDVVNGHRVIRYNFITPLPSQSPSSQVV